MPSMHQLTQQCLNFIWHLLPCLCSAHCLAKLKTHLVSILWITRELYVDYAKASWLKLVFRMENADAKCRPLSFSWASVNVTCWKAWHKMSEQSSGGMKTGRERKIPSEEHWQTWQKGKISHTLVSTGEQADLWINTHSEKVILQFETPVNMTMLLLTTGVCSLESFLSADFPSIFFYLPVILKSLKNGSLTCLSSATLPNGCSEGVTAVRR